MSLGNLKCELEGGQAFTTHPPPPQLRLSVPVESDAGKENKRTKKAEDDMNVERRKRKLKEGLCRDAEKSSFRVVGLAVDDKGSVERWMGVRESSDLMA